MMTVMKTEPRTEVSSHHCGFIESLQCPLLTKLNILQPVCGKTCTGSNYGITNGAGESEFKAQRQ